MKVIQSTVQEVKLPKTFTGRQFCLESLSSYNESELASVSELDLLDKQGNSIPHTIWTIRFADSEEMSQVDGSALNAINGQAIDYWITASGSKQPHRLVIDLGIATEISGLRYTSSQDSGRIKNFRIYIGDALVADKK